jgi:hypothetical protein
MNNETKLLRNETKLLRNALEAIWAQSIDHGDAQAMAYNALYPQDPIIDTSIDATGWAEAAFEPLNYFAAMRDRAAEIMREGNFTHNAFIQQAIARG